MPSKGSPVNRLKPMAKEIEAKFRIANPGPLRARLQELEAQPLSCVLETNHLFDTSDRRLYQTDCGLRVRQWRSLAADGGSGATLTFKGPRQAGELKIREEYEAEFNDPDAISTILEHLGFSEHIRYEKRRETWRLDDGEVTLDELPRLGWFTEIEGPTVRAVEAIRTRLNLGDCPLVQETYVHLVTAHLRSVGEKSRHLRFES